MGNLEKLIEKYDEKWGLFFDVSMDKARFDDLDEIAREVLEQHNGEIEEFLPQSTNKGESYKIERFKQDIKRRVVRIACKEGKLANLSGDYNTMIMAERILQKNLNQDSELKDMLKNFPNAVSEEVRKEVEEQHPMRVVLRAFIDQKNISKYDLRGERKEWLQDLIDNAKDKQVIAEPKAQSSLGETAIANLSEAVRAYNILVDYLSRNPETTKQRIEEITNYIGMGMDVKPKLYALINSSTVTSLKKYKDEQQGTKLTELEQTEVENIIKQTTVKNLDEQIKAIKNGDVVEILKTQAKYPVSSSLLEAKILQDLALEIEYTKFMGTLSAFKDIVGDKSISDVAKNLTDERKKDIASLLLASTSFQEKKMQKFPTALAYLIGQEIGSSTDVEAVKKKYTDIMLSLDPKQNKETLKTQISQYVSRAAQENKIEMNQQAPKKEVFKQAKEIVKAALKKANLRKSHAQVSNKHRER